MERVHLDRSKLAQVFSTTGNVSNSDVNIQECFSNLERLLTSELKTWWDHKSLKMYFEKKMIPRGLRLRKTPTMIYAD